MKFLKLFLVTILFNLTVNLLAQDFYLIGGTNISTLSKPNEQDNLDRNKQLGFQIGTIMDIKILNNFFFSPQANFTLKKEGYKQEVAFVIMPDNMSNTLHLKYTSQVNNYYIDLPLAFKYSFTLKNIELYPFAGPYVSLLLFDNSESEFYVDGVPQVIETEIEEKFINDLDYGVNIGLGLNYKAFLINVAADLGLYREMKYENFKTEQKFKNTVLKLSLGYKL